MLVSRAIVRPLSARTQRIASKLAPIAGSRRIISRAGGGIWVPVSALAVASAQPSPVLPQLPLLGAEGVGNAEADGWIALFAPARTPIDVQSTLSEAVLATVGDPKVADLIRASGVTIDARPPEALRTFVTAELSKWAGVIKDAGISME